MKSKISGRSYVILFHDDDKYPVKVNRKKTDKALAEISAAMEKIQAVLQSVHNEKDMDLYRLLGDEVFDSFSFDCSNGTIWELRNAAETINEFQVVLASHDDEIPLPEESETLWDLGYRYVYPRYGKEKIWEKVIVDTDEQTETEEIIPDPENPIRRSQTILWEKHDCGRRSVSVKYRKLPVSKKLRIVIQNTVTGKE